ncbi:MAG: alanine--tRNA ligase [Methanomassiliicoccaceae archaeon]|jgi:alanyl-tRNA synthetase|nr:alanine--tRNA ligase [Methanomassiliicoccaceae archaeon]
MNAKELRNAYVDFFKKRGHAYIPSASLIPENDPTVLFTTAGMHPLVPYLMGEKHPAGKRLVNYQKCIRTGDIDDIGDSTHLTFFEMLGNWSLGDYFKEGSIKMSYDLLTEVLKIKPDNLAVTAFEGNENAPKDMETYNAWKKLGFRDDQIFFYGMEDNWWGPAGLTGPCGPDTEIFYDDGRKKCGPKCGPACKCGKYVEIWNNVFMEYNKKEDGSYVPLSQQNVDTGMGLERVLAMMNGVKSAYDTELFIPTIKEIERLSGQKYEDNVRAFRIIADHLRSATFLLGDDRGVAPSKMDQGYVLRRLIRRASRYMRKLGIEGCRMVNISKIIVEQYSDVFPELERNKEFIYSNLAAEEEKFNKTLDRGLRIADRMFEELGNSKTLDSEHAFRLYDTFGFPIELTKELADERGVSVDIKGFEERFKEHQEKSRAGAEQKFKGGLADSSDDTVKLHTATHLLNAALRQVLSADIMQKGSNITPERLRFDFNFDRKMTPEEIQKVSDIVNDAIKRNIDVVCEEIPYEEARRSGAIGVFEGKYQDIVKVYTIEGVSKEMCGGPHVSNTGDIGGFKIQKEESSAAGVRRIKAVVGKF